MSMVTSTDNLQWTEIANINNRLYAIEENIKYLQVANKNTLSYLNNLSDSITKNISPAVEDVKKYFADALSDIGQLQRQMVKAGQDLTYFGKKVGELDATDAQLWAAHAEQGKYVDGINSRLSAQVVELGGKVGGGGDPLGGIGAALGGVGIGSLLVLGLVAFVMFKGK